jgi:quercetin dioxygenase-like cupin family protein
MLVKEEVAVHPSPVKDEGAMGARMAVLIGPQEGAPNFIMRRIELDAGGCTPHHSHDWEHVVFILKGTGKLKGEKGDLDLKPGSSVLVMPGEVHQFAADPRTPLVFLCTIPKR